MFSKNLFCFKKHIKQPLDPLELQQKAFNDIHYTVRKSIFEHNNKTEKNSNKIVMLGDSLTNFCEWNEFFDLDILNRGICGDTITGVKLRLKEIAKLKPSKIFLMIGINNFSLCFTIEETKILYKDMLETIRQLLPDTKLYLQSILPVRNYANKHIANNEPVIALNKHIQNLSTNYNAIFINLYDVFCDKTGQMKQELAIDGIHLNLKGYQLWHKYLNKYMME